MSKKLPAIYRSEGTSNKVNKEVYYSFIEEREKQENSFEVQDQNQTVEDTIHQIFNRKGYPFNVPVRIKLPGKEFDTFLAAKTKTTILTLDDEVIPIASILEIKIKKP